MEGRAPKRTWVDQQSVAADEVREAFASACLPLGQAVAIETYDDEGARATFEGRRWQDVAASELAMVSASLRFLTPPAVGAYLPAFLLAALADPDSGLADSTVDFVKPPKDNPSRPSYFAWWSLLSPAQRTAVVSFLRAMPDLQREHRDAIHALEAASHAG